MAVLNPQPGQQLPADPLVAGNAAQPGQVVQHVDEAVVPRHVQRGEVKVPGQPPRHPLGVAAADDDAPPDAVLQDGVPREDGRRAEGLAAGPDLSEAGLGRQAGGKVLGHAPGRQAGHGPVHPVLHRGGGLVADADVVQPAHQVGHHGGEARDGAGPISEAGIFVWV